MIRIDDNPDHNANTDPDGNAYSDVVKDNTKHHSEGATHCQADPNEPMIVFSLGGWTCICCLTSLSAFLEAITR